MSVLLLILGLLLFVALVVVHEFGHYLAARRNGVEVEEFGIGFPPTAWKRKLKNGVLLSVNWLPLGGFVRLKGEHDSDTSAGSYGAAGLWAKCKIMLAGVGMNLLAAWLLLTFLALVGLPRLVDNQYSFKTAHTTRQEVLVGYIEPNSPAQKAGLKERDQIVGIGFNKEVKCQDTASCALVTEPLSNADDLKRRTQESAGQQIPIEIKEGSESRIVFATLRTKAEVAASLKTDNPKGYLGIVPTEFSLQRYSWGGTN